MGVDRRVVAVAVAAAVLAAAALLLATHRGGAPQAVSTGAGVQGGQQAAGPVRAESLAGCGGGDVVAIVYRGGQEKLAEKMAELLGQQLAGDLPEGAKYCLVPAEAAGLAGARVLPLILVKSGSPSQRLAQLLLNETIEGYRPVRYDVDAVFATQVALQYRLPLPSYGVEATAVILEPRVAAARLDPGALEAQKQLLALIEAVFAANITGFETLNGSLEGFQGNRPGLVLQSTAALDEGNPALERLPGGYYAARNIDFAKVFMQRGLVEAMEVEKSAEELGLAQAAETHPSIGSGPIHVAVFEDFMCPFCASFYNETLPTLEDLAAKGEVTLHFLDFLVHTQDPVPALHRLLLCYYNETGDSRGYLEAAKRIYGLLLSDLEKLRRNEITEQQLVDDYKKLLEQLQQELGANTTCPWADRAIEETTRLAQRLGIAGTPGFAAWREGAGYVVVTEGFRTPQFFQQLVEDLKAQG